MTQNIAADELRLLIERIERLEEEKKGLADDIRDVYSEAKARGYDVKTMRQIVKLRKLDVHERREMEAMLDTYKAALGMLDGTPLGRWAMDRLSKSEKSDEAQRSTEDTDERTEGEGLGDIPDTPTEPEPDTDEAREMGRTAAREGRPVTSNPFPARDIRRAAWDEAWCQELGSDGMDIPDALKPKPKKPKSAGDGASSEGPVE